MNITKKNENGSTCAGIKNAQEKESTNPLKQVQTATPVTSLRENYSRIKTKNTASEKPST